MSAATADEAPEAADKKKHPRDPAREVVETIVFVVVLVLLLKLFVTEAFVIPTGSMAETLYGYQKIIVCPKCGHEFPVNSHDEVEANQTTGKKHPLVRYCCPNCRHLGRVEDLSPRPTNRTGDRVLVLKPLYHIRQPHRGDVVVFKYPEKPQENHVAANYIKRAMGFGGETIAIHRGDLFMTTSLAYPEEALDASGQPLYARPANPLDLWKHEFMYPNSRQAEDLFDASRAAGFTDKVPGGFRIVRKEVPQLLADRRIVWDNDKQPKDLAGIVPPRWQIAGNAGRWNADNVQQPRAFSHNGGDLDWIHYRHLVWKKINSGIQFKLTDRALADLREVKVPEPVLAKIATLKDRELNRDRNRTDSKFDDAIKGVLGEDELKRYQELIWNFGGTRVPWRWPDHDSPLPLAGPIDNMLGYNAGVDWNPDAGKEQSRDEGPDATRWVGDLILECEVELSAGSEVVLELSKGPNRFQAKFGNGEVSLARIGPLGPEFGNPSKPCKVKDGTHKLRFANVDCRLWVWVDDKLIDFGTAADYSPAETTTYEPEDKEQKEGWTRANDIDAPAGIGARGPVARVSGIKLHRDVYYTRDLRAVDQTSADIFYVQPEHYLCLGDNSAQSSDSRKWGTVPERLMLGKAVFVFWPAFPHPNRVGFIK